MRIESVALTLPSRRISNDDLIRDVAERSAALVENDPKLMRYIKRALIMSGSDVRTWRDRTETTLGLTLNACKTAIAKLDDDRPVDLVINAGVYGELLEPSSANLIAHELGLDTAECFDIREACDGWMKAAKIAYALIESGFNRRIMVINAEFLITPGFGVFPDLFVLQSRNQVEHRFPAYTVGEAAAVTIFGPGTESDWEFKNVTCNHLYDLCTITMPWGYAFSPRVAKDGPGRLTSYGADLRNHGTPIAVELFRNSGINPEDIDILFTHSSSKKDWRDVAEQVGMGDKLYDIYARCGNVISAAIPAAMALAEKDGSLKRGMNIAAWVASAGMSFSTAKFIY